MSENTTVRQRARSSQLSPEIPDVPPVVFVSLVSPIVYLVLTFAYSIMGVVWYSPDLLPALLRDMPVLGNVIRLLISYPILNYGLIWFTIIAHIFESFFAFKFCSKHNFSISCTTLYIAQTLYCGGFCLRVLFKYKPINLL